MELFLRINFAYLIYYVDLCLPTIYGCQLWNLYLLIRSVN